ncbi:MULTISPECIES: amino acid ABC transporter permease [unclassified Burkholderia]|uniref:amino acid ABC transporter permease n=1 Tax=unclassified Burkholderia TaxID=2613784 RepID=UPI000F5A4C60|nr:MULTISPECIES: amino acid ABC transporter permease [unclassified Burkholderia]RQR32498.1 amino acid ABC transporter permease [Burkholderia sp. Bp9131]RQR67070.1 amino acid ABC transporter permease [Burkholderia sp. Bp9015]
MFDFNLFTQAVLGKPLAIGAVITILLSLAVGGVSLVISLGMGALATSHRRSVRWTISSYVWFFRGTPGLLVLLVIWNGLPQLIPAFRATWFSPFLAAFIALTLIEIAYLSEILRSAYSAIDPGQREGAAALGMSRSQTFLLVILPQAFRVAVPNLINEFISLVKSTSLATIISLKELMTVTQFAIATSFQFLEWYGAALVYYLVIVSALTVLQHRIERRLSRGIASSKSPTTGRPEPVPGTQPL